MKAGGYDEDFQILADYKLWSTLLQKGCCLWNMPEVLSGYMVSPESFGYANVSGRSLEEAAEIIRSNAAVLAKCSISIAEAADIYRFFTLNMNRMALKQIISTESLFIRLSKRIRTRNSEIRFFLFKQYLKYFLTHIQHPATDIFGHAVRSLAKHGSGLLAKDRMTDSFRQILLSRRWKHRQLSAFSK